MVHLTHLIHFYFLLIAKEGMIHRTVLNDRKPFSNLTNNSPKQVFLSTFFYLSCVQAARTHRKYIYQGP